MTRCQTAFFQLHPAVSFLGVNSLAAAGKEIKKLGLQKALVVTDKVRMLPAQTYSPVPRGRTSRATACFAGLQRYWVVPGMSLT